MREICDFEHPQRNKESEVSRAYNVCNNVKLPHEHSVWHSCHSLNLLPYCGCRTSSTYFSPTDRQIASPSECRYFSSYECLAGRQNDAGFIRSGASFTRSIVQQHKDRAKLKQNELSLCRYLHSRDQAISGVGIKFHLGNGQPFRGTFAHRKGTLKIANIYHPSSFDSAFHFSKSENYYFEDPCRMLLALLILSFD